MKDAGATIIKKLEKCSRSVTETLEWSLVQAEKPFKEQADVQVDGLKIRVKEVYKVLCL